MEGTHPSPSPHVMRAMLSPSPSRVPLPPSIPGSRRGSSAGSLLGFPTSLPPPLVSASPRSLLRPRLDRSGMSLATSSMPLPTPLMGSMIGPVDDPFWEGATIAVNQPVGSLSISPNSRDVCLASRNGLYILDLKNLETAPRFVPQGGTWQIADCQWSPHSVTDNLILSTSSQKLLVWDLAAQVPLFRSVDAHERAVTDINWHALNPNLMATVAMDAGVRGWDLRMDMSRPFMRLSAWGAAGTQVKWNRRAEHVLATAHGKDVAVWDTRKGSMPLEVLKAHDAKIYGIDWDRREAHTLVTCSLDKTIKQWRIPALGKSDEKPDAVDPFTTQVISTGYPVWRARNLPFGHGILSLPQRGETALEMFGINKAPLPEGEAQAPVERFEGSTDVVKEFVWRVRGGNDPDHEDRDFQLVTWSKDRKLRVWPVPREVTERVGYKRGAPITVLMTRAGARDITFTNTPGPGAGNTRMPLPIVDNHTPTAPSGIARQRLLANTREAGMTRGGKRTDEINQIEWLTKVVKTGKAGTSDASTGPPSRAPSVAGDSSSRSRSRSRGRISNDAIRPLSLNRAPSMSRHGSNSNPDSSLATGPEPMLLKDEVLMVHKLLPKNKINFEKIDLSQRKLTMSLNGPWANGDRFAFIRIHWSFPPNYPYGNDVPTFELERNATVSAITRHRMITTIKEIRSAKRQCLVEVTEFLLGFHERTGRRMLDEDDMSDSDSPALEQNVPMLIRTTGAVFGPNGQLACFFPKHTVLPRARTSLSRSPSGRHDSQQTRFLQAYSTLSRLENPHKPAAVVRYRRHQRRLAMGPVQARSTLTLHNVSQFLPEPDVNLAAQYCTTNVDANLLYALEAKRLDHAEVWASLRALLADPPPPYSDHPPLQRQTSERAERFRWERDMERKRCVLDEMFDRLMEAGNIQLLALVACILQEHDRCAPPPPEPISMVQHSPQQDYFVLPTTAGTAAHATPVTVTRRHSSLTTPTTPPIPSSGPSSFRTSGWSQILMNPSSISLRGMALTPRDRTSFEIPRTPKEEYDDSVSPTVRGSAMGVSIPRADWSAVSASVPKTPGAIPQRQTPERRNSAQTHGQRQGRDTGIRPLNDNSPTGAGAIAAAQSAFVTSHSGLPRDRSGSSEGYGASGWSSISARAPRVSFGSSSPLRRAFTRPGAPMPAPLPHLLERRRRQQTCSVRIDLIPDPDAPPPSLLRKEMLPLAEAWKLAYADFLFRAGLVGRRAALLQYQFAPIDPVSTGRSEAAVSGDLGHQGLVFATVCAACRDSVTLPGQTRCEKCDARAEVPSCAVCRLPIKGLATTCTVCTHTSHIRCLRVVLESTGTCPACACNCLQQNGVSGSFLTVPKTTVPFTAYGFTPEKSPAPQQPVPATTTGNQGGFFNMSSAMNALTSLSALNLNLSAGGNRLSPSPTGLVFDGPHHAGTSPEHYRRNTITNATPTSAFDEYYDEVGGEGEGQQLGDAGEGQEHGERERERRDTIIAPTPQPPAPREGLLARSRLRALGTEGILGW